MRRGLPSGARSAYSRRSSTLRRARSRSASSSRSLAGSSSRSAGSTITSAPASSPSSFSSGGVNAACTGPAAADHHDLPQPRADDRVDRLVRRVRRRELLGGQRQHADAVDGDVAVPDHDRALVREVELQLLEVRMAVVPGDECGGGPRAGQILAGDPEPPVGLRADRVDDSAVQLEQLLVRDVTTDLDVAEEAEAGLRRRLLEGARDGLDVLVIGRDAEANEAPRRRQAVDQVDLDDRILALQQGIGRIEAGGTRTDDGDAQRRRAHGRDRSFGGS